MLHLALFTWAWRRHFLLVEAAEEPDTLKGPISFRRRTISDFKSIRVETDEMDFGRWFEKFDDPPKARTKQAGFELPLHVSRSMQHINRYGNSWEVVATRKL